jgi:hypothetical protein
LPSRNAREARSLESARIGGPTAVCLPLSGQTRKIWKRRSASSLTTRRLPSGSGSGLSAPSTTRRSSPPIAGTLETPRGTSVTRSKKRRVPSGDHSTRWTAPASRRFVRTVQSPDSGSMAATCERPPTVVRNATRRPSGELRGERTRVEPPMTSEPDHAGRGASADFWRSQYPSAPPPATRARTASEAATTRAVRRARDSRFGAGCTTAGRGEPSVTDGPARARRRCVPEDSTRDVTAVWKAVSVASVSALRCSCFNSRARSRRTHTAPRGPSRGSARSPSARAPGGAARARREARARRG